MWNQNQSGNYESSTPGFPDANIQPRAGYSVGYTPSYDPPPAQYVGHHQTGYQSLAHGTYAPPPGPPPVASRYDYPSQEHISSYAPPPGPPPPHTGNYPPPDGPPLQPPTERQLFNNSGGATQQHHFMYSQCTGNKKALCIGINYFGQKGQLGGCINDVQNITQFLMAKFGYKQENMVILTDDHNTLRRKPTKENIIQGMKWLVRDAAPNDSLFFHYSGHGGQTKDLDGDEADGYDEVIYPVDYQTNGHILDDLMHDIMVKPIPAGCRLTAIFDSCHSGSVLDLPYVYSTEGKIKEPNLAAEAGHEILSAVSAYARGDMGGVFKSALGLVKTATGGTTKADEYTKKTRTSPADVISWSGCKDSQTSADTQEAGEATGAMSYAFISSLNQNSHQSYQQLLVNIREILRSKYSQKPQLSSSHPMDTRILFIC